MIKVEWFYWLCAGMFLVIAGIRLSDPTDRKRFGSAAFWAVLSFAFVYGTLVVAKTGSALIEGVAVLLLALLAGLGFPGKGAGQTTSDAERASLAERFGNMLFVPALLIPLIAVIFGAVLN